MIPFVQTNTEPGNCWQTAIAAILEIDPSCLPDQVLIDRQRAKRSMDGWLSFHNALQGFLRKHRNMIYVEFPAWQMRALGARPGWHIICGPTERSARRRDEHGRQIEHCVVGKDGEPVWDVHPSRAGLINANEWRWGVLLPRPVESAEERERQQRLAERDPGYKRVFLDCICPSCYDQDLLKND